MRRKYYRKVDKEKLRLAEAGMCQECIRIVCRYLSTLPNKQIPECTHNHLQMKLFQTNLQSK